MASVLWLWSVECGLSFGLNCEQDDGGGEWEERDVFGTGKMAAVVFGRLDGRGSARIVVVLLDSRPGGGHYGPPIPRATFRDHRPQSAVDQTI